MIDDIGKNAEHPSAGASTTAPDQREATAVGDLNSDEKGSGARKNEGKPQLDLIPLDVWIGRWDMCAHHPDLSALWEALLEWQNGATDELMIYLHQGCPQAWLYEAVKVLEFGAQKYKAWNWAKGMAWSVCTGCIIRHMEAIMRGEEVDQESGLLHVGHIICNVIFLARYATYYPEGDDRPPR